MKIATLAELIRMFESPMIQNAFIAGTIAAIAAGVLGYFVLIRGLTFQTHCISHVGIPGATGAVMLGLNALFGYLVFAVLASLFICSDTFSKKFSVGGSQNKRGDWGATSQANSAAKLDEVTGIILAFSTGLGFLFSSINASASKAFKNVLFGSLFGVSNGSIIFFAIVTIIVVSILIVNFKVFLFSSLDSELARTRGIKVDRFDLLFTLLLSLVIALSVQVVGSLLLFALVVTPAATAVKISGVPKITVSLSVAISLISVWSGLIIACIFNFPPSFGIVFVSTLIYLIAGFVTKR
jgi:zinc/manganese transport system permease protein